MTALLVALALAVPPCWADGHNQHRSETAKSQFRHAHPCPGGPDKGSTRRCRGHVIDHVCSLANCGLDSPVNMQWQTSAESKAKDRVENTPAGRTRWCNAQNSKEPTP